MEDYIHTLLLLKTTSKTPSAYLAVNKILTVRTRYCFKSKNASFPHTSTANLETNAREKSTSYSSETAYQHDSVELQNCTRYLIVNALPSVLHSNLLHVHRKLQVTRDSSSDIVNYKCNFDLVSLAVAQK